MKRFFSPVIFAGVVLTIACLFLYMMPPAFIEKVSLASYDTLMRWCQKPTRTGRVVIVDIDEPSLQNREYGQWPWPRYLVAELTGKMLEGGASVVAFDIVFAEADRTSPESIKRALDNRFDVDINIAGLPEGLSDFDSLFSEVMKEGNVVLGCYMFGENGAGTDAGVTLDPCCEDYNYITLRTSDSEEGEKGLAFMMRAEDIRLSISNLNASATKSAFFNTVPDMDNVVRSCPLVWSYGENRVYGSLALAAVCLDRGVDRVYVSYDRSGVLELRLKDLLIPTDQAGRLVVNYRMLESREDVVGSHSFPVYSAGAILSGKVNPDVFKDKIVFVGTSAAGLRDLRATPVCAEFPGVEIHATMVDNILAGDMLRVPTLMRTIDMATILLVGIMLTTIIDRGRSWLSFLLTVLISLTAVAASYYLINFFYLVFNPARLIMSVLMIYMILTMLKFWQEEGQKRQVRKMFGTMVSQEVLAYLEENPGSFSLTGEKRDATMFFSDVAGFTSISENLEPEKLSELLNRYLSPMTDIIMNRRGYVDKYEGDAIMAEWGVPFPVDDHAVQACLAAIEQQETLDALRPYLKKQFGYDIFVRMGLNSGRVTAGNMGSGKRQQFTVMGDAVNQAARLEPTNKDYGTKIMIGEPTFEQARHAVEGRLLDKIVVVGKTVPVKVYELITRKGELSPARADVVGFYEEALKLHWDREWDKALDCLVNALRIDPDDSPCKGLRDRIEGFKIDAPPEGWSGERRRTSKD